MFSQIGPVIGIAKMVANGNPQKCAMINSMTNIVENVIMADPAVDPVPTGYLIIGLPDESPVTVGWIYDPNTGTFTDPNPPAPEPTP